ncbi:glucosamine 6-phosphate N-acetyltransferase [Patella vulgata]|uniref:glucosamine 6-phosphate N-acetyltransferase n=1 Tax=Patella vulgata TaxID=6465 RepID=UPI00217FF305|nr:glucosamine 6-phosphate N-acetyltransferase [Patella vulgata]
MSVSHNIVSQRGDDPIYNPSILDRVDFTKHKASFNPPITPSNICKDMVMRPLCLEDYDRGYMELLDEHVPGPKISKQQFTERFIKMKSAGDIHFVTVIEDLNTNKTIASATLVNELKFLFGGTSRGRIEDVVVSKPYRGRQFAKILVETLTLLAAELGCYEASLETDEDKVPLYSKFGYTISSSDFYMTQRFIDHW